MNTQDHSWQEKIKVISEVYSQSRVKEYLIMVIFMIKKNRSEQNKEEKMFLFS